MMKPENLQKLVTFAMPYGKYKGRVIADLPGHYLSGLLATDFLKGRTWAVIGVDAGNWPQRVVNFARPVKKVTGPSQ